MNKYRLDENELSKVRERDRTCVYCHKNMVNPKEGDPRENWATIEHLNHLPPWDNHKTIAICCYSCNASRGRQKITNWFNSEYCRGKSINIGTVDQPVVDYIKEFET